MNAIIMADIIGTVLRSLAPSIPYTMAAHRLLLGTAAHESGMFRFIDQKTNAPEDLPGPAYGYFQMEKPTHDDLWYWLWGRAQLRELVNPWLGLPYGPINGAPHVTRLYNPYYAAAMARLYYWRSPMKMPADDDVPALAAMYKRLWNTPLGAATEQQFVHALVRAEQAAADGRAQA